MQLRKLGASAVIAATLVTTGAVPASAASHATFTNSADSTYNNPVAVRLSNGAGDWASVGETVGRAEAEARRFYVPAGICVEYDLGSGPTPGPTRVSGIWIDIPDNVEATAVLYPC